MCQPGGGRWALGFGDRKHRRTAVETRSAAALGQQVLCCRWSARGSIKRAPANSQRPPACITTNQQPLGRAKSADGPASAASHRSNMAFLSTRTPTPPGRGAVNTWAFPAVLCCEPLASSRAKSGFPGAGGARGRTRGGLGGLWQNSKRPGPGWSASPLAP